MTSSDSMKPSSESVEPEIVEEVPAELEPPKEQLPAVITIVRYIVFCIPCGSPPKALHAFNDKDVRRLIRDLYAQNDQQYMFVVRNGELGRLYKTKRGLAIRFREAGLKLKIPISQKYGPMPDGWIGD